LGGQLIPEIPNDSEFFYEIGQSPAYELTLFIFTCQTYTVVVMSVSEKSLQSGEASRHFHSQVGVDSFFYCSCSNLSAHFEILSESYDGDKKKFIEKHQTILSLTEELNDIFKPVVFIQFLISSTLLCVLGFQLVMLQGIKERIVVVTFAMAVIIQLFIYAYGGQIVDTSESVADDLYHSDRDLVAIIARSQKTAKISSGFFTANLKTFADILTSAHSLIAVLKYFEEKSKVWTNDIRN
jgi:hypothetical protein